MLVGIVDETGLGYTRVTVPEEIATPASADGFTLIDVQP